MALIEYEAGSAQHSAGVAPADITAAKLPNILASSQPNHIVGRRNTAKQVSDDDRNQILPDSHALAPFQSRRFSALLAHRQRTEEYKGGLSLAQIRQKKDTAHAAMSC